MDLRKLHQNHNNGFTLIELTVTLLLITVILGLVLPRLGNLLYASDLKHSLRRLRTIFSAAQSLAVSDHTPRRIVCDIPSGEIRIERELREDGDNGVLVHYAWDNSVLLQTYRLPPGVVIQDVMTETGDMKSDGEATIRIGPNGMFTGNIIHLRKGDESYTLLINPLTGRITMEEGYIEEYKVAAKGE